MSVSSLLPVSYKRWAKIEGYNDLLNPKLKGASATSDPSNASSLCTTNKHACRPRWIRNEQAWTYVKIYFTLVDGKLHLALLNVYKAVADGEMAVGTHSMKILP